MVEELRILGINMTMPGAGIMEKLINRTARTSELSEKEINMVLEAWETRHYVPRNLLKDTDRVRPVITKEEVHDGMYSKEEYKRNYVEQIERYLQTI